MKPFLLLQSRPEDAASDNEYEAFLKFSGLKASELKRARIENGEVPEIDFGEYSGIILGGGPTNASDSPEKKKPAEIEFENKLYKLMDGVVLTDFPFLGTCYGIGIITTHQQGKVSRKYGEDVGASKIELTQAGKKDPLLKGVNPEFEAFVGHKEACEVLPNNATLLATSKACPVQMYKVKNNVYTTQFHTELDADGLALRINIYKNAGYFPPEDAQKLINEGYEHSVTEPEKILKNFVKNYAKT